MFIFNCQHFYLRVKKIISRYSEFNIKKLEKVMSFLLKICFKYKRGEERGGKKEEREEKRKEDRKILGCKESGTRNVTFLEKNIQYVIKSPPSTAIIASIFAKRCPSTFAIDHTIDHVYLLAALASFSSYFTSFLFLFFSLSPRRAFARAFRDRSIIRVFRRVTTRHRRVGGNGSVAAECDITDFAINAATRTGDFPYSEPGEPSHVTTAMQVFIRDTHFGAYVDIRCRGHAPCNV